jgi:hypothetical protein
VITGVLLARAVVAVVGMLVLGGCSAPEPAPAPAIIVPSPPPLSPSPMSSHVASTGAEQERILDEYRRLWREVIPAAAAAKPSERREILESAMVDPALSEHLAWLIKLDRAGQRSVGRSEPIGEVIRRHGNTAVVTGCLNSANVATVEVPSGRYVSRGLAQEVVVVTYVRGDDTAWRVSGWKFPKDPRC